MVTYTCREGRATLFLGVEYPGYSQIAAARWFSRRQVEMPRQAVRAAARVWGLPLPVEVDVTQRESGGRTYTNVVAERFAVADAFAAVAKTLNIPQEGAQQVLDAFFHQLHVLALAHLYADGAHALEAAGGVAAPDAVAQRAQGHHDGVVLVLAHGVLPLGGQHADHRHGNVAHPNHLIHRVLVAKQLTRHRGTYPRHLGRAR